MERRRFPREGVVGSPFRATLVLIGSSLIQKNTFNTVEISAKPVNVSCSGICLTLDVDAHWETLSPKKEIHLSLEKGPALRRLRSRVVYLNKKERTVGLKFSEPLSDISGLLTGSN